MLGSDFISFFVDEQFWGSLGYVDGSHSARLAFSSYFVHYGVYLVLLVVFMLSFFFENFEKGLVNQTVTLSNLLQQLF